MTPAFLAAPMDTHTLTITRPCPVELDVDRSGRQFFCDHCQKDVHVLANWPRAEAEAFIAANRGNSVCVSLRRDDRGELQYADSPARIRPAELVPVARLRRRWLPEAAAAAGVVAALSACTPHGPVQASEKLEVEEHVSTRSPAGGILVPDQIPPKMIEVEGGVTIPEPRIERGEKPAITPTTAPPRPRAPKKAPKPEAPKPRDLDIVDGGIDF